MEGELLEFGDEGWEVEFEGNVWEYWGVLD